MSPVRPDARRALAPLSIEEIVAVEAPREFRLHPRERLVACTAEAAGARQLFILALRGGPPLQVTASEKDVSDPDWSPEGRRLAFCRDDAVWSIDADGGRLVRVDGHPAGVSHPRWSPDGRRIAFISRRRGWAQVWRIDAPLPRRGRPPARPRPVEAVPVTGPGDDIESFEWAPDGRAIVFGVQRDPDLERHQLVSIDVETGRETPIAGARSWDDAPRFAPDGSLLYVSDADGWFQVMRRQADGVTAALTAGEREHGEPNRSFGMGPVPSPDGSRFVHVEIHDGLADIVVAPLSPRARSTRRSRPAARRQPDSVSAGMRLNPWDGVWRTVGWLADGQWVAAIGESDVAPQDLWLLPVPGVAPATARPRRVTASMPAALAAAFPPAGRIAAERIAITARDGLRVEGTLWRPPAATGRRGGDRVPAVIYPHGGPTSQSFRGWAPFKQLLVRDGFAVLDVDFRGSTGYGRDFRHANHDEWGHADVHDVIDAARWAAEQPWCDGRLAIYGGSYGGYMVLCALVEEPSMWRAGIDLYGDSEIAESYRHGDRLGRRDLERMMGNPDDPERPDRAAAFRRGSPVYRAERIEAPLLILHGRRDKRVVPLMTERMVEALTIEGKHFEVHWYDDEAHGWDRRENRRDAFARTLAFLKRHVLGELPLAR